MFIFRHCFTTPVPSNFITFLLKLGAITRAHMPGIPMPINIPQVPVTTVSALIALLWCDIDAKLTKYTVVNGKKALRFCDYKIKIFSGTFRTILCVWKVIIKADHVISVHNVITQHSLL